jgi:ABC-type amino acid transport substrate-binding protein
MIRVVTPYYYLEKMPFSLKERQLIIHEIDDLKKYKLAKICGVKHTSNITRGLSEIYEMNKGLVDVVLTNTLDGELTLDRLGYKNIVPTSRPLALLPLYHYINKNQETLVPIINQEILRLQESGELKKLIELTELDVFSVNRR